MATVRSRAHAKAVMLWLIENENAIGYSQGPRRMELVSLTEQELADGIAAGKSFLADCSGFATAVHKLAGFGDPNGLGYNGTGYTGTMLDHLPHYADPAGADVGALVVWRSSAKPDGYHVAIMLTPGQDPWLCSHGGDDGPKKIRLSTETAAQKQMHGPAVETVFLNVSEL